MSKYIFFASQQKHFIFFTENQNHFIFFQKKSNLNVFPAKKKYDFNCDVYDVTHTVHMACMFLTKDNLVLFHINFKQQLCFLYIKLARIVTFFY